MENKLILLALVECDHGIFHDINNENNTKIKVCKVRICQDDLIRFRNGVDENSNGIQNSTCRKNIEKKDDSNQATFTGNDLFHILLEKCYEKSLVCEYAIPSTIQKNDEIITYDYSSYIVEIYHPNKCRFESLQDSYIKNCDIVNTFGKRIRCNISFNQNDGKSTHTNHSNVTNVNNYTNNNVRKELLQIMGRHFEYDPNGMDFAGRKIVIKERINNQIDGTGLNVWDGALLMALYFEKMPGKIQSKTILELGSGTGFVGIATAILGAREVIITDLEYTLQLMQDNLSSNMNHISINSKKCDNDRNCLKIECHECDWFKPPPISDFGFTTLHPEIILVADCVWVEELVDPLMNTLDQYCQDETIVVITYQQRGKATHVKFWNRLKTMFQSIVEVDTEKACGLLKPDCFCLLECRKVGNQVY